MLLLSTLLAAALLLLVVTTDAAVTSPLPPPPPPPRTIIRASPSGRVSLAAALAEAAAAASAGGAPTTVLLEPGVHRVEAPLQMPSGVRLSGGGRATVSGAVEIGGWAAVPGKPWLHRAPLPEPLQGRSVHQLFVSGQRRGAARSLTMRFSNLSATGLVAAPGQLLPTYANASAMLCLTYQHWTAAVRQVIAIDVASGAITLDAPPAAMTGDAMSGSRYALYNAPEYLSAGPGTFVADGTSILYAPLAAEHPFSGQHEVLAAKPGLYEIVSSNNTADVALEDVTFAHTDVE